jgi:Fungal Zn(2)-Cys(6) binuclear cluster domain
MRSSSKTLQRKGKWRTMWVKQLLWLIKALVNINQLYRGSVSCGKSSSYAINLPENGMHGYALVSRGCASPNGSKLHSLQPRILSQSTSSPRKLPSPARALTDGQYSIPIDLHRGSSLAAEKRARVAKSLAEYRKRKANSAALERDLTARTSGDNPASKHVLEGQGSTTLLDDDATIIHPSPSNPSPFPERDFFSIVLAPPESTIGKRSNPPTSPIPEVHSKASSSSPKDLSDPLSQTGAHPAENLALIGEQEGHLVVGEILAESSPTIQRDWATRAHCGGSSPEIEESNKLSAFNRPAFPLLQKNDNRDLIKGENVMMEGNIRKESIRKASKVVLRPPPAKQPPWKHYKLRGRPRKSDPSPKKPRTKSHSGCWTCKRRKRKCDETKPSCESCSFL